MTEKERWDQAAVDYQAVFRLGLSDYNRELLSFWTENGTFLITIALSIYPMISRICKSAKVFLCHQTGS